MMDDTNNFNATGWNSIVGAGSRERNTQRGQNKFCCSGTTNIMSSFLNRQILRGQESAMPE